MTRTARLEDHVQVGILLIMGGMAGAASFTHIHDLSVTHGQPSWIGWANAIVVELMSIASGLESRRRKRAGQSTTFVHTVLCAAVTVSLAAQVAEAEPSAWGWIVAALPAVGFLAVVKIVLTRTPLNGGPDQQLSTNGDGPVGPSRVATDTDARAQGLELAAHHDLSAAEEACQFSTSDVDQAEDLDTDRPSRVLLTIPSQHSTSDHAIDRGVTDGATSSTRSGPVRSRADSQHDQSAAATSLAPVRSGPVRTTSC
jgi:hypothetical protein